MKQSDKETSIRVLNLLLEHTKNDTIRRHYSRIAPYEDGRIRTKIGPFTETGRLASSEDDWWPEHTTNLQNLPKKTARLDEVYDVRRCLRGHKDNILLSADLSQAELYAYLAYAGDTKKIRRLEQKEDLHSEIAAAIYSIGIDGVDHRFHRVVGKFANYSLGYGGGWKMFLAKVNKDADLTGVAIDAETAKRAVRTWKAMNPRVVQWWRRTEEQVHRHGYLVNCFGRRRDFIKKQIKTPEIIAWLPQSTIADHLNAALARIYRKWDPRYLRILLQVHDEIVVECSTNNVTTAAQLMKSEMQQPLQIGEIEVEIPVEIKVGENWSEMQNVKV